MCKVYLAVFPVVVRHGLGGRPLVLLAFFLLIFLVRVLLAFLAATLLRWGRGVTGLRCEMN
jgi:hypothetical protein